MDRILVNGEINLDLVNALSQEEKNQVLLEAIQNDNIDVVRVLLDNGANPAIIPPHRVANREIGNLLWNRFRANADRQINDLLHGFEELGNDLANIQRENERRNRIRHLRIRGQQIEDLRRRADDAEREINEMVNPLRLDEIEREANQMIIALQQRGRLLAEERQRRENNGELELLRLHEQQNGRPPVQRAPRELAPRERACTNNTDLNLDPIDIKEADEGKIYTIVMEEGNIFCYRPDELLNLKRNAHGDYAKEANNDDRQAIPVVVNRLPWSGQTINFTNRDVPLIGTLRLQDSGLKLRRDNTTIYNLVPNE